ncbi:MAG TPA: sigma-54 dependent transcriptional regulator [Rhodocyclaceae bacterium]|nr:sigma-54 dependent transcriptional regulator [Rhodocyclaceae bacterium]
MTQSELPVGTTPDVASDAFGGWQESSILIVDDEPGMRSFLQRSLQSRCGLVETAASVDEAGRLLSERPFDLIILDNSMPGKKGVEWLHEIREAGLHNEVIVITAFADLETAIRALQAGAADFLQKPFRINQILNAIGRCFDRVRLRRENFVLRRELDVRRSGEQSGVDGLIGDSPALQPIRAALHRLAVLPTTVLITGESGTGKEVAARALHQMSGRAASPFVPLNCGAIAPEIIESELFGHLKGAFTGAASSREGLFFYAQGGTLFLDEIGELPLALQAKLLRVLEDRKIRPVGAEREIPVDVRIVAATNRDLQAAVQAGTFRQDLYYRLNVVQLNMPALRERADDIPALVRHFLRQLSTQLGVLAPTPGEEELTTLRQHPWPGNVRELRNVMERWLILGNFPFVYFATSTVTDSPPSELTLESLEKQHILKVLTSVNGNKSEAARRLGVSRKTLERKCTEWGV